MAGILDGIAALSPSLGRLLGAGLNKGAEVSTALTGKAAWTTRNGNTDWRVKITLPPESDLIPVFFGQSKQQGSSNKVLSPLASEGGVIFPLTPAMIIQNTANYTPMSLTHSNYPFQAYNHSEVASISCTGEFPVQNSDDAQYWVAMVHFFRSVTKMFFGGDNSDALKGNPPPILRLNGYGKYVFNNIPVVVTSFSVDLPGEVDYISTQQYANGSAASIGKGIGAGGVDLKALYGDHSPSGSVNSTWAPTLSRVTLQLQPIYSRESMKKFNMRDFVNGNLSGDSGIGYI